MARRKLQRLFIGMSALGAAACSLLVSTSDLERSNVGESSDASAESPPVSGDGSVLDGGGITDADSASPADVFCAMDAFFCDDFERQQVQGLWQDFAVSEGGVLEIVSGTPTGRALHAFAPPNDASRQGGSLTTVTIEHIDGKVTMKSRVRLGPSEGGVYLNELFFLDNDGGSSRVFPFLIPNYGLVIGEVRCESGTCTYNQTMPATFSLDAWHDLALSVDFRTNPTTFELRLDEIVLPGLSQTGIRPGTLRYIGGPALIEIPHGTVDMMVDNFAITVE